MTYYLVRGCNGVIIQEIYGKAVNCQKYIHKSNIKKFQCFGEAEQAALEHLEEIVPYYIPIPTHIEVNELITRARLDRARTGST